MNSFLNLQHSINIRSPITCSYPTLYRFGSAPHPPSSDSLYRQCRSERNKIYHQACYLEIEFKIRAQTDLTYLDRLEVERLKNSLQLVVIARVKVWHISLNAILGYEDHSGKDHQLE